MLRDADDPIGTDESLVHLMFSGRAHQEEGLHAA